MPRSRPGRLSGDRGFSLLGSVRGESTGTWLSALRSCEQACCRRVSPIVRMVRFLGREGHHSSPLLCRVRDFLMNAVASAIIETVYESNGRPTPHGPKLMSHYTTITTFSREWSSNVSSVKNVVGSESDDRQ